MTVMALIALVLLISSSVIFGVAVTRSADLSRLAGTGFATSIVLFAAIGFELDNWVQSVASALMPASSVWIVLALSRPNAAKVAGRELRSRSTSATDSGTLCPLPLTTSEVSELSHQLGDRTVSKATPAPM